MLFVDSGGGTDAHLNLALEEHVLRERMGDDDLLLFYVNAPAIIIGRNQNTIEEIADEVVLAHGIQVVRRISGGGAVYHDLGNLNFSFMTRDVSGRFNRYDTFNRPVVEALQALGVPAVMGGRNDILVAGRKISGNAQFASGDRMLSHGTLLLNSDLDAVTVALRPRPGKVESKGVKSVRSRVANISEFLATPITVVELQDLILERIFGTRDRTRIPTLPLGPEDRAAAEALRARKYGTWEWNYGENPTSNVQRVQRFAAGELDVRLDIQDGHIAGVRIFGDYLGRVDVGELEARLRGLPYTREAVAAALDLAEAGDYFGGIARDDVLNVLGP
ncbi:MAG TPA: lipoate--protein ligase [Gemmatimonadales bacterium]|nr:lipoate--protein ligase [Gemmatimonadales bacterium]